jgi:hypothetical protein
VVVIPLILVVVTRVAVTGQAQAVVIDPGVETGQAQAAEIDPGVVTSLAQVAEIDPVVVTNLVQVAVVTDQALDRNQVQEAVAEIDPVPEQDLARGRNQVQGQDQVRVTGVPLVARARVEGLHPEIVNVVHPVDPVNQDQEVHRAEVVVDVAVPVVVVADAVVAVAEVVVVDVDVDLK